MGVVVNWSTGYNGTAASVDNRVVDMPTLADGVHDVMASHVNTLADAVIALQTRQASLITTVASLSATVAAHDVILAALADIPEGNRYRIPAAVTVTVTDTYQYLLKGALTIDAGGTLDLESGAELVILS